MTESRAERDLRWGYIDWEELPKRSARAFFKAYVDAHPARLAGLEGEVAATGGDPAMLDLTPGSLVPLWVWAQQSHDPPELIRFPTQFGERFEVQPGVISWHGLVEAWEGPEDRAPPMWTGGYVLSLDLVRVASFVSAYLVEMLSRAHPGVEWEMHDDKGAHSHLRPCFGGWLMPEQAADVWLADAISGKRGADADDYLLAKFGEIDERLRVQPTMPEPVVLGPPVPDMRLDSLGGGEYLISFSDDFAHRRSARIDRFATALSKLDDVDSAHREDREVVMVTTSLNKRAVTTLAKQTLAPLID